MCYDCAYHQWKRGGGFCPLCRNDIRDVVQQPAEKRLKIDSNTKNSSKKFLTPPPKDTLLAK